MLRTRETTRSSSRHRCRSPEAGVLVDGEQGTGDAGGLATEVARKKMAVDSLMHTRRRYRILLPGPQAAKTDAPQAVTVGKPQAVNNTAPEEVTIDRSQEAKTNGLSAVPKDTEGVNGALVLEAIPEGRKFRSFALKHRFRRAGKICSAGAEYFVDSGAGINLLAVRSFQVHKALLGSMALETVEVGMADGRTRKTLG
jgi:hypothetical protein